MNFNKLAKESHANAVKYGFWEKRIQFGLEYVTKWAKSINIDLDWHIDEKMKYNATRPPKHGKAY